MQSIPIQPINHPDLLLPLDLPCFQGLLNIRIVISIPPLGVTHSYLSSLSLLLSASYTSSLSLLSIGGVSYFKDGGI